MDVPIIYLPKEKGGRLRNVATFCTACDSMTSHASWNIEKTLQSADTFAQVGIAKLLEHDVVVKIMSADEKLPLREQEVLRVFKEKPHKNIVQGICTFICKDNPIRWQKRITAPQPLCNGNLTSFIIVVQEYIPEGNLQSLKSDSFSFDVWFSMIKQMTFACMEWFESYGFLYLDWHFGNILLDRTTEKIRKYNAFGRTWRVRTYNVSPLLTDFSRSVISKNLNAWQLTDQIGYVWDIFFRLLPSEAIQERLKKGSMEIGKCETIDDIIVYVETTFEALKKLSSQ